MTHCHDPCPARLARPSSPLTNVCEEAVRGSPLRWLLQTSALDRPAPGWVRAMAAAAAAERLRAATLGGGVGSGWRLESKKVCSRREFAALRSLFIRPSLSRRPHPHHPRPTPTHRTASPHRPAAPAPPHRLAALRLPCHIQPPHSRLSVSRSARRPCTVSIAWRVFGGGTHSDGERDGRVVGMVFGLRLQRHCAEMMH